MAEHNRDRQPRKAAIPPLLSSLLGRDKPAPGDARESVEESMRYPVEILYGFAAGALFGLVPLALVVWLFKQGAWATLRAAIDDTSSPLFYLFWLVAGVVTALIITGGFVLVARMRPVALSTLERVAGPIPATGQEDEREDDQDKPE